MLFHECVGEGTKEIDRHSRYYRNGILGNRIIELASNEEERCFVLYVELGNKLNS